jgi:hypothetical protein
LSSPGASIPARKVHSGLLTCVDPAAHADSGAAGRRLTAVSWSPVFDRCPMCDKTPVEPVRIEGQMACRACTSSCVSCSAPCVPGDEMCQECLALMSPPLAVSA